MQFVYIIVVFGILALPALADQITLKNGDKLTGKITTSDASTLTLKTEYAGDVKIKRDSIASITAEEPLNVQLADRTIIGSVAPAPEADKVTIQAPGADAVTAPLAEVAAFRDDPAQRAYERELERNLNPRLNDFWQGFFSFSMAGASGNADTATYSTSMAASRAAGKNKMALYFNQVYATQSTAAPTGATANRISGGYRIDRDVSRRLFVFGTTDYDYDQFLDLDLRSVLGGGLGLKVWKAERGFLDIGSGGVFNREKFGSGLIRKAGELLINEELGLKVNSRLKLSQRLSLYPNLSDTGQYRFNFDTGASMPVFGWLEWNIGFSSRFLSNPPPGRQRSDLLYTTGIRLSFDQTRIK
jgi:putative salt-induced outer membrane protein YdiY